jgi:hypothetical protein
MGLFRKKVHFSEAVKDNAEALIMKGTALTADVKNVEEFAGKYRIVCDSYDFHLHAYREFVSNWVTRKPSVGIGGKITVYVDDVDADGEYFVDV